MFIGLDLGTTNVKALLIDSEGAVLARASAPVTLTHAPSGAAEQSIDEIFEATITVLAELAPQGGNRVQAIGISSQGGALQMLTDDMQPIGPVISWMDGRGKPYDESLTAKHGRDFFIEHTGHGRSFLSLGQILRLRDESPDLLASPNRVGFVGDTVIARLTGHAAHDATSASIAWLYNPTLRDYDPTLLEILGITRDQLPDLLGPTESVGGLTDAIAARTGLPAGTRVTPAVHDQYAAAAGAGSVRPGDMMIGTGTAWVVLANDTQLQPPVTQGGFTCTHVADGLFGQMASLVNGGSAFQWALDLTGHTHTDAATIDAMMSAVAPGCDGLRVRPTLAAGGGEGLAFGHQGCITGLTLACTQGHLLRATVEGLACELARNLAIFEASNITLERLILTGGAGKSALTPQILANITNLPITCATEPDTSAFGAGVLARAMVTGAPLAELATQLAPVGETITPDDPDGACAALLEDYLNVLCKLGV
jgi:sugar (pentulose or hexulose) kinase